APTDSLRTYAGGSTHMWRWEKPSEYDVGVLARPSLIFYLQDAPIRVHRFASWDDLKAYYRGMDEIFVDDALLVRESGPRFESWPDDSWSTSWDRLGPVTLLDLDPNAVRGETSIGSTGRSFTSWQGGTLDEDEPPTLWIRQIQHPAAIDNLIFTPPPPPITIPPRTDP